MHFFAGMHVPRCDVNTTLSSIIFSREYQLFAYWLKMYFWIRVENSCCQSVSFLRYVASKLSFHSILHPALPMLNGASNPASRQPRPLLSVIRYTICGAVCFQFTHFLCDDWENAYILCLLIINSEVWTITHCLGLGHETMVCAVFLSIFLA